MHEPSNVNQRLGLPVYPEKIRDYRPSLFGLFLNIRDKTSINQLTIYNSHGFIQTQCN